MADLDDDELLQALGVEVAPIKAGGRTPREERIIAGFEDILRFHEAHGRAPQHCQSNENGDIFERLYAVRLDQLRKLPEARALLVELDKPGLLSEAPATPVDVDELAEDDLLAELGVSSDPSDQADITVLRHVRSHADRQIAEEIADRTPCEDFDKFQPLFERAERELNDGLRKAILFKGEASVEQGNLFIVGGQFAYVADKGEEFQTSSGQPDARLRLIYGNGTESNLLMRSLQKALTKDINGRRLSDPDAGPLFGDTAEPDDIATGTIYVLRSLSKHPFVSEHRMLIHKIGVTGGKVQTRIADAENQATYLLAPVEIVAEYKLHSLSRVKMENIFHRLFGAVQLDLTIEDRFGKPVKPREWFVVPLHVIDEAVQRIRDGTITEFVYDPHTARLEG
ncbi:MAG: GIY-YIG nuclease family protein [Sterolibacteriaceae bacterium]|uniref:GIY-YIG nuclease family protein n=1 Tax=Candidatus Methylophosphatis roskildensis TaxID=2899263 RepID=A0A9D7DYC8_9PROT|nr:GIY-YIG nuclease family protein [Candidatus Methylophosphatis roskildensis]MBK7238287.1 GIY-YIG nuclease family protein [Sterolibacteriaceae bacterium]